MVHTFRTQVPRRAPKVFPKEMIDLVRDLNINTKNQVVYNALDTDTTFVSNYYTPNIVLSELSRVVLNDIKKGVLQTSYANLSDKTVTYKIKNSGLLNKYPSLKMYFKILFMEIVAITYTLEYKTEYSKYFYEEDVANVREVLNYILDIIGMDTRYIDILLQLRDIDIELGYIEVQSNLIRRRGGK